MGGYIRVLLRLYRALIASKFDYGCIVDGYARPTYINDWILFATKVYEYVQD